ncbi:MAG: aminotransferase class I/II-fold pyridoxal phosphate-dependent enzyme [Balneolales bacterium]|nr:aminotransferase class I/II-fold pyridoxal phosphate-dependent enzyme [Balneolales bacterium]
MAVYISKRGKKLIEGFQPLVKAHFKCAENPWHPETNPAGYINLGTAENHLLFEELKYKLNPGKEQLEEMHTHYAELHGMASFREALALYAQEITGVSLNPENIAVASGSSAILDMLFYVLCEPGDGVVIPAPYYAGFDHDLKTRINAEPLPAYTSADKNFELTRDVLQQAMLMAGKRQIKVRALLITNPNNPLGRTYSRETLEMLVDFALEHKVQLVADELYAKSVFGENPYISLLEIAQKKGVNIHWVYGFAKDFALSGFKTGMLYSSDDSVIKAVKELCYFMPVSNATQATLENIVRDNEFVQHLQSTNKQKLLRASQLLNQHLKENGMPQVSVDAGFFALLDLRKWLNASTFEDEMALYNHIFDNARVNLTPGQSFHAEEPGFFRICYARDENTIRHSLQKIGKALLELNSVGV